MMISRQGTLICLLALAIFLSGCRESAPLAPKSQVQGALSDLGLYCGQATELETFGGHSERVRQLDSAATARGRQLIRIMLADPHATYLGQSMRRVVGEAASETRECRLYRAATLLSRALQ